MLRYGLLVVLMVVSAIGILLTREAASGTWFASHWVFIMEGALITLFGVFWVLQTIDRRDDGAPRTRPEPRCLQSER